MKRFSLISLLILICSLPGYSQFWIDFHWDDGRCRQCETMAQSLHMTPKQANDYHKIVHKYGKKIEKEARRDYKHWDKAARKIYDLRIDRDKKVQRILMPSQFRDYVRYSRENPKRIHDYRGWYENPRYTGRRQSPDWRRYEDNYWSFRWDFGPEHRNDRYDNRPYNPSRKRSQEDIRSGRNNSNTNRSGRR